MKPPLQIPVPFGHWLVESNKLTCRMPRRTVTVQAPRRLLAAVAQLCDGSTAWNEVLEKLGAQWSPAAVTEFMLQLASQDVLVEASSLWAHWSDVAQLPQTTAVAATAQQIARLPGRAEQRLLPGEGTWDARLRKGTHPLSTVLSLRESVRTFDDRPISVEALCSLLWAAHGVSRASASGSPRWHRTVASGGNMHSARWFVAVLRELAPQAGGEPPVAPGVYEARFHVEGGASLQRLHSRAQDAWQVLSDPRVLRYASALVLPVYDVATPGRKYGNRATLFAMLEAGQSLQNAQLMAVSLELGCMVRGDTCAAAALDLCGLGGDGAGHWLALPGLVVGAQPTASQRRQLAVEHSLKVSAQLSAGTSTEGFAFAATFTPAAGGGAMTGSGRAADPKLAMTKAEAEAWERLGWATLAGAVEARWDELGSPVDPRELVAYSQRQYASASFPCTRFDAGRRYLWVKAQDVASGTAHEMLAECVHALSALPGRFQARAYTVTSTSGVAAGPSPEEALARATLELIERDAFACHWLAGSGAAVRPGSLPRHISLRLQALRQAGLQTTVVDIDTGWCPVWAVFSQAPSMPFTAVTAAAAFDPEQALEKAIDEAEGRFAHARAFARPQPGADAMREIERYYRSPRTFRRSDFFVHNRTQVRFGGRRTHARSWSQLESRLRADGLRVLASDLTPAQAAIEQGRTRLHVVRAFVPGLVPIWFHKGMQPAGMPRFMQSAGAEGGRPAGHFIHPMT